MSIQNVNREDESLEFLAFLDAAESDPIDDETVLHIVRKIHELERTKLDAPADNVPKTKFRRMIACTLSHLAASVATVAITTSILKLTMFSQLPSRGPASTEASINQGEHDRDHHSTSVRGVLYCLFQFDRTDDVSLTPSPQNVSRLRNCAGVFVPVLHDAGVLGSANGYRPADKAPTLKEMEELFASNLAEFEQNAPHLSGCYAYSLGYRDATGQLHGIRRSDGDRLPIIADRPPFDQKACSEVVAGNSPNHCRRWQNVLSLGGHAKFETTRNVGIDWGNTYLNRNDLSAAGFDPLDTCLGSSGFKPSVPKTPENSPGPQLFSSFASSRRIETLFPCLWKTPGF
jgi:hypothetical protein